MLPFILRLPFLLVQQALRRVGAALGAVTGLVRRRGGDGQAPVIVEEGGWAPAPPPTPEEAIDRRFERERERVVAPAPPPPPEGGHVNAEVTIAGSFGPPEDVGATFEVAAPWDGYDAMGASAVVARLALVDEATRAMVRLYEQQHRRRPTILRATS